MPPESKVAIAPHCLPAGAIVPSDIWLLKKSPRQYPINGLPIRPITFTDAGVSHVCCRHKTKSRRCKRSSRVFLLLQEFQRVIISAQNAKWMHEVTSLIVNGRNDVDPAYLSKLYSPQFGSFDCFVAKHKFSSFINIMSNYHNSHGESYGSINIQNCDR